MTWNRTVFRVHSSPSPSVLRASPRLTGFRQVFTPPSVKSNRLTFMLFPPSLCTHRVYHRVKVWKGV